MGSKDNNAANDAIHRGSTTPVSLTQDAGLHTRLHNWALSCTSSLHIASVCFACSVALSLCVPLQFAPQPGKRNEETPLNF